MIANVIRYDLEELQGIENLELESDEIEELDFSVSHNQDIFANLIIDPLGEDNAIKFVAKQKGKSGNKISVEYIVPEAATSPVAVSVTDKAIKVTLETNNGNVMTQAVMVASRINNHPEASQLVLAQPIGTLGTVPEVPATNLVGGSDEPFSIIKWNTEKLGPQKTIAEYRAISKTPEFKQWAKDTYRQRKLDHGHKEGSKGLAKKVAKAFPE